MWWRLAFCTKWLQSALSYKLPRRFATQSQKYRSVGKCRNTEKVQRYAEIWKWGQDRQCQKSQTPTHQTVPFIISKMLILAKQPKTNLSAPARNLLKIAGWRHQNVKTQLEFDKYAQFGKVLCNPIPLMNLYVLICFKEGVDFVFLCPDFFTFTWYFVIKTFIFVFWIYLFAILWTLTLDNLPMVSPEMATISYRLNLNVLEWS